MNLSFLPTPFAFATFAAFLAYLPAYFSSRRFIFHLTAPDCLPPSHLSLCYSSNTFPSPASLVQLTFVACRQACRKSSKFNGYT